MAVWMSSSRAMLSKLHDVLEEKGDKEVNRAWRLRLRKHLPIKRLHMSGW